MTPLTQNYLALNQITINSEALAAFVFLGYDLIPTINLILNQNRVCSLGILQPKVLTIA